MSHEFHTPTAKSGPLALENPHHTFSENRPHGHLNTYRMASPEATPPAAIPHAFRGTGDIVLTNHGKMQISERAKAADGNAQATAGDSLHDGQIKNAPDTWHGWQRGQGGSWVKQTEPPKDWNLMSPREREGWLQRQREKNADDWSLVGPHGEANTGWHTDPGTGQRFWFGYAGETPPPDPDPTGRSERR